MAGIINGNGTRTFVNDKADLLFLLIPLLLSVLVLSPSLSSSALERCNCTSFVIYLYSFIPFLFCFIAFIVYFDIGISKTAA